MTTPFEPTREAGLTALTAFLPNAGAKYASGRNFDHGPDNRSNVSVLSPYIRHRLILESEVAAEVLKRQSFSAASKFIQEVCWRTYWKGWLETRPALWTRYLRELDGLRQAMEHDLELRSRYEEAIAGRTGIEAFDAWANELKTAGYVHNHARMWFASIWIFTLRLPWQLGADFFFRCLYDGDPASNTLSWRWVAGLHTKGKTYLARPGNIETYTDGRFNPGPGQLASRADALHEEAIDQRTPLPVAALVTEACDAALLVTEEDCNPETLPVGAARVTSVSWLDPALYYGPDHSSGVLAFKRKAVQDAARRAADYFQCEQTRDLGSGASMALTAYCPAGPLRDYLSAGNLSFDPARLRYVQRDWDRALWPHASSGFFKLKEKIPSAFRDLGLV